MREPIDRRTVLAGTAASVALLAPGAALAQRRDTAAIRTAVATAHADTVKRLQQWIADPTIAAEGRNVDGGAETMMRLARDAGFQNVEKVPTAGVPGVFATLDAGARKTVGIYFMYDVKQFEPAEWSSPPLEARLVDRPGLGRVMVGRGAVNQKGPQTAFLAALHAFRATGRKLPVNLVLVAEGEEEIGSPNFKQITDSPRVRAALAKCSGVIIPSANQGRDGSATLTLGREPIQVPDSMF